MASTSYTFTSLSSSSAQFVGPKISVKEPARAPTRVHFRPPRISAACASTAERVRPHIASPSSLYEVLGLQMSATCQEIKAAYRRLARVLHPDAAAAAGQADDSAQEFIKVHEAYATLSDPEKRADYDRKLLFRRRRSVGSSCVVSASAAAVASSMASGFSGFTRRSWETDQCW